jgi:hypothetical protein
VVASLHEFENIDKREAPTASMESQLYRTGCKAVRLCAALVAEIGGVMNGGPTTSIQPRRHLDRYKCKHKISYQNSSDLRAAQRRRLECSVGPPGWRKKDLHL